MNVYHVTFDFCRVLSASTLAQHGFGQASENGPGPLPTARQNESSYGRSPPVHTYLVAARNATLAIAGAIDIASQSIADDADLIAGVEAGIIGLELMGPLGMVVENKLETPD